MRAHEVMPTESSRARNLLPKLMILKKKKKPSPEEFLDVFYFRKLINTKLLSRKICFCLD